MEPQAIHVLSTLLLRRLSPALFMTLVLLSAPRPALPADISSRTVAPGKLINIGTHRLHIYCRGYGSPAVIMDAGLGDSAIEWISVQTAISRRVRVCIYDRAGYGWSEPGPYPRTSSRITDELYLLLKRAGVSGPLVLVGHSFGGYNMQLFASRYPDTTAGLVLVDSSHADQLERYLAPPIGIKLAPVVTGDTVYVRLSRPMIHPALPDELKRIVYQHKLRMKTRRAMAAEYIAFRQSAIDVKNAGDLPDIPLFVITRGKRVWARNTLGDHMERLWLDLQSELADRSTQHAHIIAAKSGHHIHLDQPQLVIDAVNEVINTVQQGNGFPSVRKVDLMQEVIPTFKHALLFSYNF